MASLDGNTAELEAELIKRNREIAKARDETLKVEKRLEECQARNDDLLEKVAELDQQVTAKSKQVRDLEEQVEQLKTMLDGHKSEHEEIHMKSITQLDSLRKEHEEEEMSWHQERGSLVQSNVAQLEAVRADYAQSLEDEKLKRKSTQSLLDSAEAEKTEQAGRVVEMRRRIKELEEELGEQNTMRQQEVEADRDNMRDELHQSRALLEEHQSAREDMESQVRQHKEKQSSNFIEIEELRRELADHAARASSFEKERDEVIAKHDEHRATHDSVVEDITKRSEEHIEKISKKAADLDGRLFGQRMMLDETMSSLMKTEREEERLAEELRKTVDEHAAAQVSHEDALASLREEAAENAGSSRARMLSELETEEAAARQYAKEISEQRTRHLDETEEQRRTLESQISLLRVDHETLKETHERMQSSLKSQHQDLQRSHSDVEMRADRHERDADQLRKERDELKLEAERKAQAHQMELDRLQQTIEAEAQSRASMDQIANSQLEEKDTHLEHLKLTISRLEEDLGSHKSKIEEHTDQVDRIKSEADQKTSSLGVRIASLEGELRGKNERIHELDGRLEAQRQYLEQLNESLAQTQGDRDALMQTKGSLEAQLALEASHKNAMADSLDEHHADAERRHRELEERILRDRDSHQSALEDVRRSLNNELKQGADRVAALEAELTTARQRCELLARNKADLQKDLAEHKERHTTLESEVREHQAEKERVVLLLDQHKGGSKAQQEEIEKHQQDRLEREAHIKDLKEEIRQAQDRHVELDTEFNSKFQRLDSQLEEERGRRSVAERDLQAARKDHDEKYWQAELDRKKSEEGLKHQVDSHRTKAENLQRELDRSLERIETLRQQAEADDEKRRDAESILRGDVACSEAKVRKLEVEVHRAQTAIEEGKAVLAQQQAAMTAKISALERQAEHAAHAHKSSLNAKEAAETQVQKDAEGKRELVERLAMAAEELAARQVTFTLDRQRLNGALEESRRTLRNTFAVPNPSASMDSVRVRGLEQQLAEERRSGIEKTVALQRAERKILQLEDSHKRKEDSHLDAASRSREAERRTVQLSEDLRKSQAKQVLSDQQVREAREQAAMAVAEMGTIRFTSKYEAARLRGHLDELRYMIKMKAGGS